MFDKDVEQYKLWDDIPELNANHVLIRDREFVHLFRFANNVNAKQTKTIVFKLFAAEEQRNTNTCDARAS